MKRFLPLLLLFVLNGCTSSTNVYVCDSQNARKYHLKADCRGLSNCSHRIVKVTLEEAKESGKTLCNWEK